MLDDVSSSKILARVITGMNVQRKTRFILSKKTFKNVYGAYYD